MDSTERAPEMEARLHELFRLIDRDDLKRAGEEIDVLEQTLGPDDEDLVRARSLIQLLEA